MKKYQILRLRDSGRVKEIGRRPTPLDVSIADLVGATRQAIEKQAEHAGLELMRRLMEDEQSLLTDGPARRGWRHGSQDGYVRVSGKKVEFANLRVRSFANKEIPLESYQRFQEDRPRVLRDMMRGVSTRDYKEGVEGFLRGYGVKRSSVSREFVRASEAKLKELMERDLSKLDLVAMFLDGVGFAGHLLIVAMGVDAQGGKHALGMWQGATENSAVCQALFDDMIRRGLGAEKRYLFIIDGGKGLRAAIQKTFGKQGEVQRCEEHKKRNVTDHLPPHRQAEFRRKMSAAYGMVEYDEAKKALLSCVRELEGINPSAAASLREGLEETLTLHRLGAPAALRTSLRTTNPLESSFSYARQKTCRVRRWRGGDQVQRWAAAVLLRAESTWKRIRGSALMPKLIEALRRREIGQEG